MANRIDLEKMFDENFSYIETHTTFLEEKDNIKDFIDTIIPEVLKEILPNYKEISWSLHEDWYRVCIKSIKQKAKEKFNINL